MKYDDWEPIYERILQDFGFDRGGDIRARDVLDGFVDEFDVDRLGMENTRVAIAGGHIPTLREELDVVRDADVVVAASSAADALLEADIEIDLVVTDLDKTPETAVDLSKAGVPVAVHAHGDNISAIRRYLPRFETDQVMGTTQTAPTHNVYNFGGFTDGDRGAFIADHLGARELVFPGWDFDDESVGTQKRRKLAWAERLLFFLQNRRNETFEVLQRRESPIEPI